MVRAPPQLDLGERRAISPPLGMCSAGSMIPGRNPRLPPAVSVSSKPMQQLRRFRFLFAAIAILFSPGGITPWLQLAHACGPETTSASGMDHAAMSHAGHQMPASTDTDGPTHHLQHCICVGACSTAAMAATNSAATIAVIPAQFRAPAQRPVVNATQSDPQYSHPFAHAPPLA